MIKEYWYFTGEEEPVLQDYMWVQNKGPAYIYSTYSHQWFLLNEDKEVNTIPTEEVPPEYRVQMLLLL